MRKVLLLLTAVILVISLAGCTGSNVSIEEIFEKSIQASENLESFHCDIGINLDLKLGEEETKSTMSTVVDYVKEPLAMYAKYDFSDFGYASEMYVTEDTAYSYSPDIQQWVKVKLDTESFETENNYSDIINSAQQAADYTKMLKEFKKYLKDFSVKDANGQYTLTLKVDGEKFVELIGNSLGDSMMPEGMSFEDLKALVDIKKINFSFSINKETYLQEGFSMAIDVSIKEFLPMDVSLDVTGKYTKINELNNITIPENIINEAIDMTE